MNSSRSRGVNWLFLILIVVMFSASMLVGMFVKSLSSVASLVLAQLIFGIPTLIFVLIKKAYWPGWIAFHKMKISTCLLVALFAVLLIPLVTFINILSMLFSVNMISDTLNGLDQMPFWQIVLIVAVMPAICEELIHRGVFYGAYREKGILMGALGSGIVFGLVHLNFNQFCYAFVLGFIFCILVESTGSIFSGMIAHFVINGWSAISLEMSKNISQAELAAQAEMMASKSQLLMAASVYAVLAFFATTLAVLVWIWIINHCGRREYMRAYLNTKPPVADGRRTFFSIPLVMGICLAVGIMIFQEIAIRVMYMR